MREFIVTQAGATLANTGLSAMFFINPPLAPNVNIEFLRYWIGFSLNATSAQTRINLFTATSSFPQSAGSGFTPLKLKPSDPNASVIVADSTGTAGTCCVIATTLNSATWTVVHGDAFNVLNGWLHVPTPPETRIMPAQSATVSTNSGLGMQMPGNSQTGTWSYGTCFREI